MTDKNVVYFSKANFELSELHLGTFTAVYKKKPLIYIEQMSGWKSSGSGQSGTAAQYSQGKCHSSDTINFQRL
jgi:hypothetical protein